MLFTGIFCLLAVLASASTAAVTTIVAAPTEAEQADAAPASGARSAQQQWHIQEAAPYPQLRSWRAACFRQNPCV
ncbi:hypothetical protein V8C86DRAFT_2729632 [Haematococcus lacustris]